MSAPVAMAPTGAEGRRPVFGPALDGIRFTRWPAAGQVRAIPAAGAAQQAMETALGSLLKQTRLHKTTLREEVKAAVEQLIAELDRRISAQLRQVMHHHSFRALEGTWRGLHALVHHGGDGDALKFRVLNVSKDELSQSLRQRKNVDPENAPLLRAVRESGFEGSGGDPLGCLMGDYAFDHGAADVALLTDLARTAAATLCPFIAAAHPRLLQAEDGCDADCARLDTDVLSATAYAGWRRLRAHPDARYVALALPRFLARAAYHPRWNAVEGFAFEEFDGTEPDTHRCWSSGAYLLAADLARSVWAQDHPGATPSGAATRQPGPWCGSDLEGLGRSGRTPSARQVQAWSEAGLTPLASAQDPIQASGQPQAQAWRLGGMTLYQPAGPSTGATAGQHGQRMRLQTIVTTCRLAQQIRRVVQAELPGCRSREDGQHRLGEWLRSQIQADPISDTSWARPLAAGEVEVDNAPDSPGQWRVRFFLRPHGHPEGLTLSLGWPPGATGAGSPWP